MILQIINIASGVVGASSLIKDNVTHADTHNALDAMRPYEARIGVATAVFGLPLGSSFPQAIPALLLGLALGTLYFERIEFLKKPITFLLPYRQSLGLIAIACGLGSLLFGCALPLVCRAPFGI